MGKCRLVTYSAPKGYQKQKRSPQLYQNFGGASFAGHNIKFSYSTTQNFDYTNHPQPDVAPINEHEMEDEEEYIKEECVFEPLLTSGLRQQNVQPNLMKSAKVKRSAYLNQNFQGSSFHAKNQNFGQTTLYDSSNSYGGGHYQAGNQNFGQWQQQNRYRY